MIKDLSIITMMPQARKLTSDIFKESFLFLIKQNKRKQKKNTLILRVHFPALVLPAQHM